MPFKLTNPDSTDKVILDEDGTTILKTLGPGGFVTMQDAEEGEEGPPEEGTLADAIAAFDTANTNVKVPVGGALVFASDTSVSGGGSGRTFVDTTPANLIRQHGHVTAFDYVPSVFSVDPNNWKFKLFRPDGTDVDQTGEGAVFTKAYSASPPASQHVLSSPLPCQPGDSAGFWMLNLNGLKCSNGSAFKNRYGSGDLSTLAPSTEATGYTIDVRPLGPPPFAAWVGDSIDAGHGTPFYRPFLDGGISGNVTGEPAYHVRALEPTFTYQNFSAGGQGWAYAATNISKVNDVRSKAVIFGMGINDLAETWTNTAARMATCKAGLTHGQVMFVREMFADNAAASGAVATRNALTATWCTANGAILIPCHDAMAQVRTATSLLEDLKSTYNDGDGIHHNLAGKQKMAELVFAVLDTYDWGL